MSENILDQSTDVLKLSTRLRNCLHRLGVTTLGELVRHSGKELLEQRNFGMGVLAEVRQKLAVHGLVLREDEPEPPRGVKDACRNCRFWRAMRADQTEGCCRRYPPTLINMDERASRVGRFPRTAFFNWCGEWQPRTP